MIRPEFLSKSKKIFIWSGFFAILAAIPLYGREMDTPTYTCTIVDRTVVPQGTVLSLSIPPGLKTVPLSDSRFAVLFNNYDGAMSLTVRNDSAGEILASSKFVGTYGELDAKAGASWSSVTCLQDMQSADRFAVKASQVTDPFMSCITSDSGGPVYQVSVGRLPDNGNPLQVPVEISVSDASNSSVLLYRKGAIVDLTVEGKSGLISFADGSLAFFDGEPTHSSCLALATEPMAGRKITASGCTLITYFPEGAVPVKYLVRSLTCTILASPWRPIPRASSA